MYPLERIVTRADHFISAYTKYADSFSTYAIGVEALRRDQTYKGIRASRLAATALGDCFSIAELDERELYRTAVTITNDEPYPTEGHEKVNK